MTDWKDFFEVCRIRAEAKIDGGAVESLYQAFKARMVNELGRTDYKTGEMMDEE